MQLTEGVTDAERYLGRLCRKSFLNLWSYPGLYIDKKPAGGRMEGKELCDLLVIFDEHILIFSDKDCAFPRGGDLVLDWCRWYKRAVLKSAQQIRGAERWIRENPARVFLDRDCTQPLPIPLPSPGRMKVHRVVVAHGASVECRARLGGTGSLMIQTDIIGPMHYDTSLTDAIVPFAIGQVDSLKGYVHVFDDTTLDAVMGILDTTSDLVAYLEKKEALLTGPTRFLLTGEEELLAHYVTHGRSVREHDFVFPKGYDAVFLEEGGWEEFLGSPERSAQREADKISYAWDELIDRTAGHALTGTHYRTSCTTLAEHERMLRFLAKEPRFHRRMLAEALFGVAARTTVNTRFTKVLQAMRPGDPYYVFLGLGPGTIPSEELYREARGTLLEILVQAVKVRFPDALDIIGVALGPAGMKGNSEDIVYFDARRWTVQDTRRVSEIADELGLFKQLSAFHVHTSEYPGRGRQPDGERPLAVGSPTTVGPKVGRNDPCPCGSGKKYKKCHGSA